MDVLRAFRFLRASRVVGLYLMLSSGSLRSEINSQSQMCHSVGNNTAASPVDIACATSAMKAYNQYTAAFNASKLELGAVMNTYNTASGGVGAPVEAPAAQAGGAAVNSNANYQACAGLADQAVSQCAASNLKACQTLASEVSTECKKGIVGATQSGANSGSLASAAGGLLSKEALIGAGLGALAGYMLSKGGDDEEKETPTEEKPPEIPPPPSGPPPSDDPGSSSSSSIGNSSSSSGIETPAVVNVPVIDTNAEGGGGASEIIVAANDAILDDSQFSGEESSSSESSSSGGETTLGGGSTGGSTGNGTEVVVNDDEDTRGTDVVDDGSLALTGRGLAGSAGAGGFLMGGQDSAPENVQGSGSGMLTGLPARRSTSGTAAGATSNTTRGLTNSNRASSSSTPRTASVTETPRPASSSGSGRSREEIRADLRRRGLID